MAIIRIQLLGSLGEEAAEFSAKEHGHAHAVNEAIAYLTDVQLRAINTDHDVRDSNEPGPLDGWQLDAKRKPSIGDKAT
jgi:hypothetical protein